MLATPGGKPFTDPDWLYEIKFDGYRCMAGIEGPLVQLRTKNLADCSTWYPELVRALQHVGGGPHLVDGEAVVLDNIGRSDFEALHARARRRRWYIGAPPVVLAAFDLLVHDGVDIMALPLVERKARLAQLLGGLDGILVVSELPAEAELFGQAVLPLKLEGFVAKRRDSPYLPGIVSRDWLKIKRPGWQEGRSWRS